MRKRICLVCLSCFIIIGMAGLAAAERRYATIVPFFADGFELATGLNQPDPTILVVVFGPVDRVEQVFQPEVDKLADFRPWPAVDWHLTETLSQAQAMFLIPEHVVEMGVLKNIAIEDVEFPMVTDLDYQLLDVGQAFEINAADVLVFKQDAAYTAVWVTPMNLLESYVEVWEITPTPEPSSVVLLGAGLLVFAGIKVWHRRSQFIGQKTMLLVLLIPMLGISRETFAYVTEFVDSGQRMGNESTEIVIMGDLDSDGDADALFVNEGSPNTIWFNNGRGIFRDSGQRLELGGGNDLSRKAALGDLDGDGDLDIFVANHTVDTIWFNDGKGFFHDSGQRLSSLDESRSVALGDLDGDGDLDAFVVNRMYDHSKLSWLPPNVIWLNNGSGQFTKGQTLDQEHSYDVALGDLDGDSDLDAFIANHGASTVWFNNGNGRFSDSGQRLGNEMTWRVILGDVDNDGDLDAAVANMGSPSMIWLNDGKGYFTDSGQRLGNSDSTGIALQDVNSDGNLDIFITNTGQPSTVWLNDGTGKFIDSGQRIGDTSDIKGVVLKDMDGDGDLDAFIANFNGPNVVWFNQTKLILTLKSEDLINDPALQILLRSKRITPIPLFDKTRGNLELKRSLKMLQTYLLKVTSINPEELRQELIALDAVESCIYNQSLYFDATPDDPKYKYMQQWNLDKIGMPSVWDSPRSPANVALAVIDAPVALNHEDLPANMPAKSFIENPIPAEHGTHVAGIAAALTGNGKGVASVAGGAAILPLAVGNGTYGTFETVFRAIEYAVDEKYTRYPAVVINLSLSNSALELKAEDLAVFHSWIQYAYRSNVPVVASMGNKSWAIPHYPAAFAETIAVGATNSNNQWWPSSNSGDWIALVAPGVGILSTLPNNGYGRKDGTSMAAPHVTGALGLLLSKNPTYTVEELRAFLKETATPVANCTKEKCGAGLLNVAQALAVAEAGLHISFQPGTYPFGDVTLGDVAMGRITIENSCPNKALAVNGIKLPNTTEFKILGANRCAEIVFGQSCEIEVAFAPQTAGAKRAELAFSPSFFTCNGSTRTGSPTLNVQLTGTAKDPIPPVCFTVKKSGNGTGTIWVGDQPCDAGCPELTFAACPQPQEAWIFKALPEADSKFVRWEWDGCTPENGRIRCEKPGGSVIGVFEKQ